MSVCPDGVEPVIAWRSWLLDYPDRLRAIGTDYTWPAHEAPPASCRQHGSYMLNAGFIASYGGSAPRVPSHETGPVDGCTCGYWSLKSPNMMGQVAGTVKLWGHIIEGEDGYRSQYAYPSHLYLLDQPEWAREPRWHREGRARLLGATYGVPCQLYTEREFSELVELERAAYWQAKQIEPPKGVTTQPPATPTTSDPSQIRAYINNQWITAYPKPEPEPEPEPTIPSRPQWQEWCFWGAIAINLGACAINAAELLTR